METIFRCELMLSMSAELIAFRNDVLASFDETIQARHKVSVVRLLAGHIYTPGPFWQQKLPIDMAGSCLLQLLMR